jgi:hypothetical protein
VEKDVPVFPQRGVLLIKFLAEKRGERREGKQQHDMNGVGTVVVQKATYIR